MTDDPTPERVLAGRQSYDIASSTRPSAHQSGPPGELDPDLHPVYNHVMATTTMRTTTRTRDLFNALAQKRGVTAVALLEALAEREAEREDLESWMEDLGAMTDEEAAAYRSEFDSFESSTVTDGLSQ